MTREEILKEWDVVGCRCPKKGEFFMGCPNYNPNRDKYSVIQCERTFRTVYCTILKKKG